MTRAIRWGAIGGAVAAAMLALPASHALHALAHARAERDRLQAIADAPDRVPAPLVAPDAVLRAPDEAAARRDMAQRLRSRANKGGVLIESLRTAPAPGQGLAAVTLSVSGSEKAVIAMADAIERNPPVMRFADWRVTAIADGSVRLQGRVIAPWRP